MAKRQNFIVGSTNGNTETQTVEQLNRAWDQYAVLHSGTLDGVFNAVSDYSNDSSNEIANAIQSITGSEPTGANQNELAGALSSMRIDIESTSLLFKGYVATSAPSASTYFLKTGDLWINASAMPTSFPVAATSIKSWNGSSWVNYGSTYTPANFHFFRNINDKAGYYWLGGAWAMFSTAFSSNYFWLNSSTGQWQISSNYDDNVVHQTGTEYISGTKTFNNQAVFGTGQGIKFATSVTDYFTMRSTGSTPTGLAVLLNNSTAYMSFATGAVSLGNSNATLSLTGSSVTVTQPGSASDSSAKVATTYWVHAITDSLAPKASPTFTGTPKAPTASTSDSSTKIATTAFVHSITDSLAPKASPAFTGNPTAPTQSNTNNSTRIATTAFVRNVLEAIYPVGAIYIGTGTSCPIAAIFGTWTRIDSGLALWTGNGTTGNGSTVTTTSTGATNKISAGLPNITSNIIGIYANYNASADGAVSLARGSDMKFANSGARNEDNIYNATLSAQNSNPIYGNSTTVQPPAYVVNVWRRTA